MIREISAGAIATAGLVLALIGGSGYSLFQHPTPQREAPSKLEQTVNEETGYKAGPRHKASVAKEGTPTYAPGVRSTSKVTTTPQVTPPKAAPSVGSSMTDPFVGPPFTNPQLPYVPPSKTSTSRVTYQTVTVPVSGSLKKFGANSLWKLVENEGTLLPAYAKSEGILPGNAQNVRVLVFDDTSNQYVKPTGSIPDKIKHLTSLESVADRSWSQSDTMAVKRVASIDYTQSSKAVTIARNQLIDILSQKDDNGKPLVLEPGAQAIVNQMFNTPKILKDKFGLKGDEKGIVYTLETVSESDGIKGDNIRADESLNELYALQFSVPVTKTSTPHNKTDLDSVVVKLHGFGINVDLNRGYSLSKQTAKPTSSQSIVSKPSLFSRFANKVSASYNAARETVGSCLDEVVHATVPSTKETVTLDLDGRNKNFKEKKTYSSIENKFADLSPINSRAAQENTKSGWFSRVKNYASKAVNAIAENSIAAVENIGYAAMPSSESFVKIGINDVTSNNKPSTYENLQSKISEHTATLKESATKSMQYTKKQASEVKETLSGIASNFGYAFKPSSEKFNALKIDNYNTYDTMSQDSIGDSYERKGTFLRLFSGGSFEAPKETVSDKISKGFGKFFGKVKQGYQTAQNVVTDTAGGLYTMGKEAIIPGTANYNTLDLERENRPLRESRFERRASGIEGLAKHYI